MCLKSAIDGQKGLNMQMMICMLACMSACVPVCVCVCVFVGSATDKCSVHPSLLLIVTQEQIQLPDV